MSYPTLPVLVAVILAAGPAAAGPPTPDDGERIKVTTQRAEKIVQTLGLEDDAKVVRVRELIARQYRDLSDIHARRESGLAALAAASSEKDLADKAQASIQRDTELDQCRLHYAFLAKLTAELTPAQVEQIKDGMTFGIVPITCQRYQELLPTLTDEQKRLIHSQLIEAREHAMDAGSSEAKHAIFGKYKGRINNSLSAAGFDLKAAERSLQQRERELKSSR